MTQAELKSHSSVSIQRATIQVRLLLQTDVEKGAMVHEDKHEFMVVFFASSVIVREEEFVFSWRRANTGTANFLGLSWLGDAIAKYISENQAKT